MTSVGALRSEGTLTYVSVTYANRYVVVVRVVRVGREAHAKRATGWHTYKAQRRDTRSVQVKLNVCVSMCVCVP